MIKMHFHVARVRFGALRPGDPCCHVYSDVGVEELLAWAEANGVPRSWLQTIRGGKGCGPAPL